MDYVYEGTLEYCDDEWIVTFGEFDGTFGNGETVEEACKSAAESLRLAIAEEISQGRKLPPARFGNPPQVAFTVEVDEHYIKSTECMTFKQAAEELGISAGRLSQLVARGQLDSVTIDGKRMITIASVNERKDNPPAPHRPRKDSGKA